MINDVISECTTLQPCINCEEVCLSLEHKQQNLIRD